MPSMQYMGMEELYQPRLVWPRAFQKNEGKGLRNNYRPTQNRSNYIHMIASGNCDRVKDSPCIP